MIYLHPFLHVESFDAAAAAAAAAVHAPLGARLWLWQLKSMYTDRQTDGQTDIHGFSGGG